MLWSFTQLLLCKIGRIPCHQVSANERKHGVRTIGKGTIPKRSTLMKPTASQLARQNRQIEVKNSTQYVNVMPYANSYSLAVLGLVHTKFSVGWFYSLLDDFITIFWFWRDAFTLPYLQFHEHVFLVGLLTCHSWWINHPLALILTVYVSICLCSHHVFLFHFIISGLSPPFLLF